MEGGFGSWENTYPHYVNEQNDVPKFEQSFDEQFSSWIATSREGINIVIRTNHKNE